MALADYQIEYMAREHGMITPFEPAQVSLGVISFGLSSHGYDARVGRDVRLLDPPKDAILDPKRPNPDHFRPLEIFCDLGGEFAIVPPRGFVLASTVEYFKIPRNIVAFAVGKSTYARTALDVHVTPLEATWEGEVTLEFSNGTDNPMRLYVGEGGCQFVFHTSMNCLVGYADRKGKYQFQRGVTLGKVKETA